MGRDPRSRRGETRMAGCRESRALATPRVPSARVKTAAAHVQHPARAGVSVRRALDRGMRERRGSHRDRACCIRSVERGGLTRRHPHRAVHRSIVDATLPARRGNRGRDRKLPFARRHRRARARRAVHRRCRGLYAAHPHRCPTARARNRWHRRDHRTGGVDMTLLLALLTVPITIELFGRLLAIRDAWAVARLRPRALQRLVAPLAIGALLLWVFPVDAWPGFVFGMSFVVAWRVITLVAIRIAMRIEALHARSIDLDTDAIRDDSASRAL